MDAVVAREVIRPVRDRAHADRVVVAARQQRRPCRRTQRRHVEPCVPQAVGRQRIERWRRNQPTERCRSSIARIVEEDDEDVGRAGRRGRLWCRRTGRGPVILCNEPLESGGASGNVLPLTSACDHSTDAGSAAASAPTMTHGAMRALRRIIVKPQAKKVVHYTFRLTCHGGDDFRAVPVEVAMCVAGSLFIGIPAARKLWRALAVWTVS